MKPLAALATVCLIPLAISADESPKADRVLRAVVHLRTLAEANKNKLAADALADHYVRGLAEFCVEEKLSTKEFLLALGVGLDGSDFLRRHPVTRQTFKDMGRDAERDKRKAALGEPTMRKRSDWLLHFALSASLTAAINAEVAEQFGIAKEWQDSLGASGFSFGDLAADDAGIAFATALLAHPERLADVAKSFRGDDFLPAIGDLEENLSFNAVVMKYGEADSEKFRAECRRIRERMNGQAIYKVWRETK